MQQVSHSEKFTCRNCGKQEMVTSPDGWVCRACWHEVHDPPFKKGDWDENEHNLQPEPDSP